MNNDQNEILKSTLFMDWYKGNFKNNVIFKIIIELVIIHFISELVQEKLLKSFQLIGCTWCCEQMWQKLRIYICTHLASFYLKTKEEED